MRIARALALAGIAARRKCETFIRAGQVTVNGEVVRDLGRQVDPEQDQVIFRGERVHWEELVYFLLNKPAGFTTTASDRFAKKTVYELLPAALTSTLVKGKKGSGTRQDSGGSQTPRRVFPVGRLDRDSTGLILFTNDGDLAQRLIHPRHEVEKWYEVELHRLPTPLECKRLLRGIRLEEGVARVERIRTVSPRRLQLLLREGKKREIRRIFSELEIGVRALCRISMGPLKLGSLPEGHGRYLTPPEVVALKGAPKGSKKA